MKTGCRKVCVGAKQAEVDMEVNFGPWRMPHLGEGECVVGRGSRSHSAV